MTVAKFRLLVAFGLLVSGSHSPAYATAVTYVYSGNPFTTVNPGLPEGVREISGAFTVEGPLGPTLAYDINTFGDTGREQLDLIDFTFSDGHTTVNSGGLEAGAFYIQSFFVETDASARIMAWSIHFRRSGFDTPWVSMNTIAYTSFDQPSDNAAYCTTLYVGCMGSGAVVQGEPGSWTQAAVVPVPGAVWLFASALSVLGRKRRC